MLVVDTDREFNVIRVALEFQSVEGNTSFCYKDAMCKDTVLLMVGGHTKKAFQY